MLEFNGIEVRAAAGLHEDCARLLDSMLKPGSNIVDLAAGAGAFSARLAAAGYRVLANDIDDKNWAAPSVPKLSLDLDTDFVSQLPSGGYDAIVAMEVIEHLCNPREFLRRCASLARERGFILLSTPNVLDIQSRATFLRTGVLFHFSPDSFHATGHRTIMPYWLLELMFEEVGLRVEKRVWGGPLEYPQKQGWLGRMKQVGMKKLVRALVKNPDDEILNSNYVIYILRSSLENSSK